MSILQPAPPISPFSDIVTQRQPRSVALTASRTTRGAQALGITVPLTLLGRANDVIE